MLTGSNSVFGEFLFRLAYGGCEKRESRTEKPKTPSEITFVQNQQGFRKSYCRTRNLPSKTSHCHERTHALDFYAINLQIVAHLVFSKLLILFITVPNP